jgi:hypothetical protein
MGLTEIPDANYGSKPCSIVKTLHYADTVGILKGFSLYTADIPRPFHQGLTAVNLHWQKLFPVNLNRLKNRQTGETPDR